MSIIRKILEKDGGQVPKDISDNQAVDKRRQIYGNEKIASTIGGILLPMEEQGS